MSYWHWSYRSTRDEASFLAWILWNVCLQRMHCQLLRTKNRILSTMHNVFALVKPCAKSTLLTGDADSFDAFYLAKRRNMTYFPFPPRRILLMSRSSPQIMVASNGTNACARCGCRVEFDRKIRSLTTTCYVLPFALASFPFSPPSAHQTFYPTLVRLMIIYIYISHTHWWTHSWTHSVIDKYKLHFTQRLSICPSLSVIKLMTSTT